MYFVINYDTIRICLCVMELTGKLLSQQIRQRKSRNPAKRIHEHNLVLIARPFVLTTRIIVISF